MTMKATPLWGRATRRDFLKTAGMTAFGTVAMGSGIFLFDPKGAWALTVENLTPRTMATLIQMARDTFPHDRLSDTVYAQAVAGYDGEAGTDAALKAMLEEGCAMLDEKAKAANGAGYLELGWEDDRVAVLRVVETTPFFGKVRGGLVTGLYNQHEIWPMFGYEGASADKGGYIHRGFDDIDWLETA
jgi:hypothetical protein